MKKMLLMLFALVLGASMSLTAQDSNTTSSDKAQKKSAKAQMKEAKAAEKGKTLTLTGWVKSENGKTVFTNDKDKQNWDVSNADALNGHDGHHVRLKAKLDAANHSINVSDVKMLKESKQAKK